MLHNPATVATVFPCSVWSVALSWSCGCSWLVVCGRWWVVAVHCFERSKFLLMSLSGDVFISWLSLWSDKLLCVWNLNVAFRLLAVEYSDVSIFHFLLFVENCILLCLLINCASFLLNCILYYRVLLQHCFTLFSLVTRFLIFFFTEFSFSDIFFPFIELFLPNLYKRLISLSS